MSLKKLFAMILVFIVIIALFAVGTEKDFSFKSYLEDVNSVFQDKPTLPNANLEEVDDGWGAFKAYIKVIFDYIIYPFQLIGWILCVVASVFVGVFV